MIDFQIILDNPHNSNKIKFVIKKDTFNSSISYTREEFLNRYNNTCGFELEKNGRVKVIDKRYSKEFRWTYCYDDPDLLGRIVDHCWGNIYRILISELNPKVSIFPTKVNGVTILWDKF